MRIQGDNRIAVLKEQNRERGRKKELWKMPIEVKSVVG